MVPFHLRYSLSRGRRLSAEIPPWIPAIAGSLGFGIGVTVLAVDVSARFLALLILPLALYRGLVALLFDLAIHPRLHVEVRVDEEKLEMVAGTRKQQLPLAGIIQVFRSGNDWMVLHFNRTVLAIPADAISPDQVEYLKAFALAAAAERKAGGVAP